MGEFTLVAVVLVLLAVVFIIFPVMKWRGSVQKSRRQINTELFNVRLSELVEERDLGQLSDDEFQRLHVELQRRLLEDVDTDNKDEPAAMDTPNRSWTMVLGLILFIPVCAWMVYGQIGAKADWEITSILKQARLMNAAGQDGSKLALELTEKLSARLEHKPNDPHYLMLLASTQMSLQNYPAATGAYQRMVEIAPNDSGVLGQYAQALYLSSNRQITDKVSEIVDRTLALNPNQATVLGMMGIYNFEIGNYQAAIDYWERLLPSLGPVSPNAKMIREGIEQARTLLSEKGGTSSAIQKSIAKANAPDSEPVSLKVNVSIDQAVNVEAGSSVFVYARAIEGPRMPLAVARLTVGDLPASITLDDSMAMAPNLKLSSFEQVEVIARVSKKGIANRGPGDIEGVIGPVTIGAATMPISLLINTVLP